MTRLTDSIRRQIIDAALGSAMAKREEELKARSLEVGLQAYNEIVPEKLRNTLKDIPPGWVGAKDIIRFNANGWIVDIAFPDKMAVTMSTCYNGYALGSPSPETADKLQRIAQDRQSIETDRRAMTVKMEALLKTFYTFKQMRDRWPEGKKFYEQFDYERSTVPTVQVVDINNMLGLSKEDANWGEDADAAG